MISENYQSSNTVHAKKGRIFYFDILRVIACCSVVMIHASSTYVTYDFGGFNFWIGNIFDSISRIGVPIFVMISGALMLDESYEFTVKKLVAHIVKMLIFFLFWSFIYSVINNIITPLIYHNPIVFKDFISSFVYGHYHLWFCLMIIGLYLLVPLLRLWIKVENKKYIEYFLILSLTFTFLIPQIISVLGNYFTVLESVNSILNNINLKYVAGYAPYFILGWYLHNFELKPKKLFYVLGILSLIFTVVMTFVLSYTTGTAIQAYDNISVNILLQSVAVFILLKSLFGHVPYEKEKHNFIGFIAKNSLGIYAVHVQIVTILFDLLIMINLNIAIINILIIFIVSLAVSCLISFVFSKIPVLKKVV